MYFEKKFETKELPTCYLLSIHYIANKKTGVSPVLNMCNNY